MINNWTNLSNLLVFWRAPWYKFVIVDEVKVPVDIVEAVPSDLKGRISSPIIIDTGKFVYSHQIQNPM